MSRSQSSNPEEPSKIAAQQPTNLNFYKMTNNRIKSILCASVIPLVVAASLSITPTVTAATGLSISDSIGDPNAISIAPGDTFTITMRLSATAEQLLGTTYSLVIPGAGSGKFTLVARDVIGTAFSDLTASNVADTVLTNAATVDLGGLVANLNNPAQPGVLYLATYTIASNPTLAPGIYTIQSGSNSVALNSGFDSIPLATSTYQVNVVPEPGTAALVFGGLGMLSILRRRRQRI